MSILKGLDTSNLIRNYAVTDEDVASLKNCPFIEDYEVTEYQIHEIASRINQYKYKLKYYNKNRTLQTKQYKALVKSEQLLRQAQESITQSCAQGLFDQGKCSNALSQLGSGSRLVTANLQSLPEPYNGKTNNEDYIHWIVCLILIVLRPTLKIIPISKATMATGLRDMFKALGINITKKTFQNVLTNTYSPELINNAETKELSDTPV